MSKNTMRTCTISDVKLMCHTHYDTFWEHFFFGTRDQSEINQIEWETITNVCSENVATIKNPPRAMILVEQQFF